MADTEKLLEFLGLVGKLKKTERSGWVRNGIPDSESVADHSFRTAILAFILGDKLEVDGEKLLKMVLIHDLPESITGDITMHDKEYGRKSEIERKAMEKLCSSTENGNEIMSLWKEFEEGKSKESRLAHELDKLEMLIQSFEYEKQYNIHLDEFWKDAKIIKNEKLIELLESFKKRK
ncbi:MAG: HD domain-containing protein [Candidatus Aenigmarchaeota archaeon]|nr:HD domain-containing protein [Candidatus Aenigmarchaeota archaeon]